MSAPIYGSVGQSGNNHRHDVTVVQLLLNNVRFGETPELRVDGLCGPHHRRDYRLSTVSTAFSSRRRRHLSRMPDHRRIDGSLQREVPLHPVGLPQNPENALAQLLSGSQRHGDRASTENTPRHPPNSRSARSFLRQNRTQIHRQPTRSPKDRNRFRCADVARPISEGLAGPQQGRRARHSGSKHGRDGPS